MRKSIKIYGQKKKIKKMNRKSKKVKSKRKFVKKIKLGGAARSLLSRVKDMENDMERVGMWPYAQKAQSDTDIERSCQRLRVQLMAGPARDQPRNDLHNEVSDLELALYREVRDRELPPPPAPAA